MTSKTTLSTQSEPTAKNRLTPIKETMQTIRGYPSSLVIDKTAASRFYWVRCYFNGKYKVKTTKSETPKGAKEFAAKFYKDILLSSVTTKSSERNKQFAVVGNLFFQSTEKNTTSTTYKADYNRYTQHILKEFNQQEVDTITNAQISQFVDAVNATDKDSKKNALAEIAKFIGKGTCEITVIRK